MESAGHGAGGSGAPQQPPGGEGGGPSGGALQSPPGKPTLERTYTLMNNVQGNCILVSKRQEGNPVLRHVRNVRWQFADIVPDYILGNGTAALYISVRYHLLHPDYLFFRIRELQRSFRLRLVLCHVDVEDVVKALGEINKTAAVHACSLVCAWSAEEVARYLETFKLYENKTAENIQERTEHDYVSRLTGALTTIKGVNKVDVVTLGSTFGTLAALMTATSEQLAACPGIGPTKVRRLHDTFHAPFRRTGPRQLRIAAAPEAAEPAAGAGAGGEAAELALALVPPPLALQPLVPPPLALQPLEDGPAGGEEEEGGVAGDEELEEEEEEEAAEDAGAGGADDAAFYASLEDPEDASDDDRRD